MMTLVNDGMNYSAVPVLTRNIANRAPVENRPVAVSSSDQGHIRSLREA
jgi:hypothetical protein